jgi:hypothetical protein
MRGIRKQNSENCADSQIRLNIILFNLLNCIDFNTDFFKSAFTQKHDISVTGGTEKTSFYASASRFDQKGIVDFTNYENNEQNRSTENVGDNTEQTRLRTRVWWDQAESSIYLLL